MNIELEKIEEIIRRFLNDDRDWFEEKGIDISEKGSQWMLNYAIDKDSDYNHLTRGMIVTKPWFWGQGMKVIHCLTSFPFTRFRNRGEPRAAQFDLANADMIEKLDGTMVGVYIGNKPVWHTRRLLSVWEPDTQLTITAFHGGEYKLIPLIGTYVDELPHLDPNYTYVFEFIHAATHVVTRYDPSQYGLYLIGMRDMNTLKELSEDELDRWATTIGVRRPRRWPSGDEVEIKRVMDETSKGTVNFEGFVFRDRTTGERVKVKNEEYVRIHHLIERLTYKNLVVSVFTGETAEIIAYFPAAEKRIEQIKEVHAKFVAKATDKVLFWKGQNLDRKVLAEKLLGRPAKRWDSRTGGPLERIAPEEADANVRKLVFRYITADTGSIIQQKIEEDLRKIACGDGKNLGNPKKYLDLIGLSDSEESEQ